jgi:hypothetical protein
VLEFDEFAVPSSGQGTFIAGFALTTVTGASTSGSLSTIVGGIYVSDTQIAAWAGTGSRMNIKQISDLGYTTLKPVITILSDGYQVDFNGSPFYKIAASPNGAHYVGAYLYSPGTIIPAAAIQATALADA